MITPESIASMIRSVAAPADEKIQKARFRQCMKCPFKQYWKTKLVGLQLVCGKPIKGSKIEYQGKKVELCGCMMKQKVADVQAVCPIGKW